MLRIAHISDLHFSKITYHPSQFFSKRWIGNLNLLLFRKKNSFQPAQLYSLLPIFQELKIDYLLVSGDISSTSLESEFDLAKQFFDEVKALGIKLFVIPGNHDQYTKKAYEQKLFYKFFKNQKPKFPYVGKELCLEKDKIEVLPLKDNIWLLGIDTACPTFLLSSKGFFSKEIETSLQEILSNIPKDAKLIFLNHFPFSQKEPIRKRLIRGNCLKSLLQKDPRILFYLHGHTHKTCIEDQRKKNLPIIASSGSSSHHLLGFWNFLEIENNKTSIHPYQWSSSKKSWVENQPHEFVL